MRTGGKISGLLLLATLMALFAYGQETGEVGALSELEKSKLREQLPHYDPAQYALGTAAPTPAPPIKNGRSPRPTTSALALTPTPASAANTPTTTTEATGKPLSLSPYIVKAKPIAKKVPRPGIIRPDNDHPIDPFLSPAAQREAVAKKYLSSFDRDFLNRWTLPLFGVSKFQRAAALYEADMKAAQLNQIADVLDVPGENKSEKEKKEMQELYERVLRESRH